MKLSEIVFVPPIREEDKGWLLINKEQWLIKEWHSFNDFGTTLETVLAAKDGIGIEVYSRDEGGTWEWSC